MLADNDVRSKLLEMGMTPQGGSVAQFQAVIDADIQKWKPTSRASIGRQLRSSRS